MTQDYISRYDQKKYLENALVVVMAVALIAALVWALSGWPQMQCANIAKQMNVAYSWSFSTKCMIEVDGRWMPLDAYYYNPGQGQE